MVDPYIRHDYQIHNLINFCECVTPTEGDLQLELVTGADSEEQKAGISAKFKELRSSLESNRVFLTYRFDDAMHDHWIETDTGWRIALGRGLDIFQKPEAKFTLGFVDQTKRRCKATTINYIRHN